MCLTAPSPPLLDWCSVRLLRFHATWCNPCKRFEPIVNAFADKHGIPIEHIDVEEQPELAEKYGVASVPQTHVVDDNGDVVRVIVGALPTPLLERELAQYI